MVRIVGPGTPQKCRLQAKMRLDISPECSFILEAPYQGSSFSSRQCHGPESVLCSCGSIVCIICDEILLGDLAFNLRLQTRRGPSPRA